MFASARELMNDPLGSGVKGMFGTAFGGVESEAKLAAWRTMRFWLPPFGRTRTLPPGRKHVGLQRIVCSLNLPLLYWTRDGDGKKKSGTCQEPFPNPGYLGVMPPPPSSYHLAQKREGYHDSILTSGFAFRRSCISSYSTASLSICRCSRLGSRRSDLKASIVRLSLDSDTRLIDLQSFSSWTSLSDRPPARIAISSGS